MSYCLNPNCQSPRNPDNAECCHWCKTRLLLNDRYRPLDPIGRGGFGKTFKARDEYKPSKPYCVIKQFHGKGFDDAPKAEELFHREAVLQENLGKHHQIPELLAHFNQDNYLYLVQEFVDGCSLNQERKEKGTFSEYKVWQLLEDLLPVLQFVHDNQVIHRDINPENIIRHRADERLFLVDFGIAKQVTENTQAGTATGVNRYEYAAPEQLECSPRFASDLYSLGATCYHLLTYADPSRLLYSWVDWQKELRGKLENKDISDKLIHILTKLLQPDISQRYESAEEVLQDLNLESTQVIAESLLTFPTSAPSLQTQTWRCVQTLCDHSAGVASIAISPDGQILASASYDKSVKLWNLCTGDLIDTLSGHSLSVIGVAFSPDGQILASGSWDKTINLWNLHKRDLIISLAGHSGRVGHIVISPNGQVLSSASWDNSIKLWNLHTKNIIATLSGHSDTVTGVAFSPNGQLIASSSVDKTIKLWNLNMGDNTLSGHSKPVIGVAFSPDGQILSSGSWDKTIKLWNPHTGGLIDTLYGHSDQVNRVTFSPDGQILVSASQDKTIKIWRRD